jgi:hypothetical protein
MFFKLHKGLTWTCFSNLDACGDLFHAISTRLRNSDKNSLSETLADIPQGNVIKQNPDPAGKNNPRDRNLSGIIYLNQVHATGVHVIKNPDQAKSAVARPPQADAVICNLPETGLVIQTADCQSVMLYDPVCHAAANIHSGWKGSVANIIGECIKAMNNNFGTRASDLKAGIGPSLGPCCAEFVNFKSEIPEKFWKYKDSHNRFDFWQISKDQLQDAGVKSKNIELSGICTLCNPHLFYSYRKNRTGKRFYSIIGLKKRDKDPEKE